MTVSTDRPTRGDYPYAVPLQTRWMDNDAYGHVNNVAYYSWFDTAANLFLVREAGLDIHHGPVIGLVVESGCRYHAPVAYPEPVVVGVRVDKLGTSSLGWGLAVFRAGDDHPRAVAHGHFVHVFVDRTTRRPTPIPPAMRAALETIVSPVGRARDSV